MKKTRLLMCAALAALALASAAFAASPPVSESPPGFDRAQVSAVAKDVPAIASTVADSGTGAASAFKAWEAKRHAAPAPVLRVVVQGRQGGTERMVTTGEPFGGTCVRTSHPERSCGFPHWFGRWLT